MHGEEKTLLDLIAQTLFDKKGLNILALDIRPCEALAEYVVLAEGTVDRHVLALTQAVQEALQKVGRRPLHVEGNQVGDWVVLDYGNVMVHLFMPGIRDRYQLEQLWQKGIIVDTKIIIARGAHE